MDYISFEKVIENLLNSFSIYLLFLVFVVLIILDQIPPFTFFIPLLLIYAALVYFLIKNNYILLVFILPFLLAFFSFLGDLIYLKTIKRATYSNFFQKHTPIKIKDDVKNLTFKKIIYSRLSPLYKIFVYEHTKKQFFTAKNLVFLYISHIFFFFFVTFVVYASILFAKYLGFSRFDFLFTILAFYLALKIIKIDI